jgi:hypothetical protein
MANQHRYVLAVATEGSDWRVRHDPFLSYPTRI